MRLAMAKELTPKSINDCRRKEQELLDTNQGGLEAPMNTTIKRTYTFDSVLF